MPWDVGDVKKERSSSAKGLATRDLHGDWLGLGWAWYHGMYASGTLATRVGLGWVGSGRRATDYCRIRSMERGDCEKERKKCNILGWQLCVMVREGTRLISH